MGAIFQMVKYHNKEYPNTIPLRCEEISSHLDITEIVVTLEDYSLHTEYSYGQRSLSSNLYASNSQLALSHKEGVPQLWKNEEWAIEFADFIFELTKGRKAPAVIEIHPPFSDYTSSLEEFVVRYKAFENKIIESFPQVQILIENRCGAVYQGGKFVLSKIESILALSDIIDREGLRLRFALDIPQLYTAHNCNNEKENLYYELLTRLRNIRHNIEGVHLWGKRKAITGRKVAHCGDLYSYFEENDMIRERFLLEFNSLFSDEVVRKLVLEVNSGNEDLESIIIDLNKVGVSFV